jgi:hypothetical protein
MYMYMHLYVCIYMYIYIRFWVEGEISRKDRTRGPRGLRRATDWGKDLRAHKMHRLGRLHACADWGKDLRADKSGGT